MTGRSYGVIAAVAFLDGALFTVSFVTERGVMRQLVGAESVSRAVAMNESAFYASSVFGPPLGGILFSLARAVPFAGDAVSYLFSTTATLLTRRPFQNEREPGERTAPRDLLVGFGWLWRRPLFRAFQQMVAVGNVLYRGLYLAVVVLAKRHGASSAQVGAMFAVIALGGLAGGIAAPALVARAQPRRALLASAWISALAMPVLLVAPGTFVTAVVVAVIELPSPLVNASLQGTRTLLVPDRLQGRVSGAGTTISQSLGWLGPPLVGLALQRASQTACILGLCAVALAVAVWVSASRGLRAPATESEPTP